MVLSYGEGQELVGVSNCMFDVVFCELVSVGIG